MKIPVPAIVVPVIVLLLYLFFPGISHQPWTTLRTLGAILAVSGYILLITARVQLGKSFAVTPQAKELVTHGLYARIRNPIYVFVAVMWLGITLALPLYWLLVPLVILVIIQFIRVTQEAKILEATFGQAYLDYRKQTWF